MSEIAQDVLGHGLELCAGARRKYSKIGLVALSYGFNSPEGSTWVVQDGHSYRHHRLVGLRPGLEHGRILLTNLVSAQGPDTFNKAVQANRINPFEGNGELVEITAKHTPKIIRDASEELRFIPPFSIAIEAIDGVVWDGSQNITYHSEVRSQMNLFDAEILEEFLSLNLKDLAKIDI
jgi:hypothetical protein